MPRFHGPRFVNVRVRQSPHCLLDVALGNGGELGPENVLRPTGQRPSLLQRGCRATPVLQLALHRVNHLETNVLPLAITVQEQDQIVGALRLLLQVPDDIPSIFLPILLNKIRSWNEQVEADCAGSAATVNSSAQNSRTTGAANKSNGSTRSQSWYCLGKSVEYTCPVTAVTRKVTDCHGAEHERHLLSFARMEKEGG